MNPSLFKKTKKTPSVPSVPSVPFVPLVKKVDFEGPEVLNSDEITEEKKEAYVTLAHYLGFKSLNEGKYVVAATRQYKYNGESIINEWLQLVHAFVLIVASNTSYNPKYFEIRDQRPEQTWVTKYTENRIISKELYLKPTDEIPDIVKTWKEDILSMVYNISVESSLEEIRNLKNKHNWNNIKNKENKLKFNTNDIESILTNRVERAILAEYVGEKYQNKRQRLVNAEFLDAFYDKIKIFGKLKRYFIDTDT